MHIMHLRAEVRSQLNVSKIPSEKIQVPQIPYYYFSNTSMIQLWRTYLTYRHSGSWEKERTKLVF